MIAALFASLGSTLATLGRSGAQLLRSAAVGAWAGARKAGAVSAAWARSTVLPAAKHFVTTTVPAVSRRTASILKDWGKRAGRAAYEATSEGARRTAAWWGDRHERRQRQLLFNTTGRNRDDLKDIECPYCGAGGRDLQWDNTDWRGRPRTEVVACRSCTRRFHWADAAERRPWLQRVFG